MLLRFTKEQLESALEKRRPWAKAFDAKRKAQHVKDEQKFMKLFTTALERAAKWDYAKAKEAHFQVSVPYQERRNRPECPQGVEAGLDRAIAFVVMDGRTRYVISHSTSRRGYRANSELDSIFWLLTHDETAKPDIC